MRQRPIIGTAETRPHTHTAARPSPRVTLAPLIPLSEAAHASTFHRALHFWNARNCKTLTWDELSLDEQAEVVNLTGKIIAEGHPCR